MRAGWLLRNIEEIDTFHKGNEKLLCDQFKKLNIENQKSLLYALICKHKKKNNTPSNCLAQLVKVVDSEVLKYGLQICAKQTKWVLLNILFAEELDKRNQTKSDENISSFLYKRQKTLSSIAMPQQTALNNSNETNITVFPFQGNEPLSEDFAVLYETTETRESSCFEPNPTPEQYEILQLMPSLNQATNDSDTDIENEDLNPATNALETEIDNEDEREIRKMLNF